jgi:hypothetical protein
MYIKDGIAYADTPMTEVQEVIILDGMKMLITFTNGNQIEYDAAPLLQHQAFKPLGDRAAFCTACVTDGFISWLDGEIDISPDALLAGSR